MKIQRYSSSGAKRVYVHKPTTNPISCYGISLVALGKLLTATSLDDGHTTLLLYIRGNRCRNAFLPIVVVSLKPIAPGRTCATPCLCTIQSCHLLLAHTVIDDQLATSYFLLS